MRHKEGSTYKPCGDKKCDFCGSTFLAYQQSARFCSIRCRNNFSNRNRAKSFSCRECQSNFTLLGDTIKQRLASRGRDPIPLNICPECLRSGSSSPSWKGGHRYYTPGRFGRDTLGLSWKTQRRLAWERDLYTCQHCGKNKPGWKPCVHHVSPWRVSKSHDLANLLCLCRKCHGIAEAKIQEWGNSSSDLSFQYNTCACGRACYKGICYKCAYKAMKSARAIAKQANKHIKEVHKTPTKNKADIKSRQLALKQLKESLLPNILRLQEEGYSLAQIAEAIPLKVNRQTIYYWCKYRMVTGFKHLM